MERKQLYSYLICQDILAAIYTAPLAEPRLLEHPKTRLVVPNLRTYNYLPRHRIRYSDYLHQRGSLGIAEHHLKHA